jgi:hypothetical protein
MLPPTSPWRWWQLRPLKRWYPTTIPRLNTILRIRSRSPLPPHHSHPPPTPLSISVKASQCRRHVRNKFCHSSELPAGNEHFSMLLLIVYFSKYSNNFWEKEVVRSRRKLRNEELYNLHSCPYIIEMIKWRKMIWAGLVVRMREMRNAHKILVTKPEGKRPLKRSRRRWENNIRMCLRLNSSCSG